MPDQSVYFKEYLAVYDCKQALTLILEENSHLSFYSSIFKLAIKLKSLLLLSEHRAWLNVAISRCITTLKEVIFPQTLKLQLSHWCYVLVIYHFPLVKSTALFPALLAHINWSQPLNFMLRISKFIGHCKKDMPIFTEIYPCSFTAAHCTSAVRSRSFPLMKFV